MDDSFANPMRTGLMFVPLGPSISSDMHSSRYGDELADLEAAIERDRCSPKLAPPPPRRAGFRRLLQRLRLIPEGQVPSPT